MENSIYKLKEIRYYVFEEPQYPDIKIYYKTLGYFSSIANAEQVMKEYIENYGDGNPSIGFWIKEHVLNLTEGRATKSGRSYLSDGSLWDVSNVSQLNVDNSSGSKNFKGRSEDEIRFKPGDIVEMVLEECVSLGIVHFTPPTIEEAKQRFSPDDLYYITPHNATWGNDGCTHYHLSPVDLFPPHLPVSDKLQKKLKEVYKGIQEVVFHNYISENE